MLCAVLGVPRGVVCGHLQAGDGIGCASIAGLGARAWLGNVGLVAVARSNRVV